MYDELEYDEVNDTGEVIQEEDEWFTGNNGFLSGRNYGIAEWYFKKEQKEFEELCKLLQSQKYSKRYKEKYPERIKEADRRWRRNHPERVKARDRRWKDKQKAIRHHGICIFCKKPWKSRRKRKYCSKKCKLRAWKLAKYGDRSRYTKMDQLRATIGTNPDNKTHQLVEITGFSLVFVRNALTKLIARGVVEVGSKKRNRRYRLARDKDA